MRVTVSRKAHFNAAHRLYRKDWSDAQNNSIFGKCSNPHYHGHNYELIAHITGEIDPETGYVMDMKVLKDLIKEKIEEVIIATSATIEGQTTAYYIQDSLKKITVKVTKLAQGLPVGGEIEQLDDGTLFSAFKNRVPVTGS